MHKVSFERLAHYNCSACKKWWSIGDGPGAGLLFCPWCGHQDHIQEQQDKLLRYQVYITTADNTKETCVVEGRSMEEIHANIRLKNKGLINYTLEQI